MWPAPPVAVTSALICRSSVDAWPLAANVISPPVLSLTGEFTVSGLLALTSITYGVPEPPVIDTPTVLPSVPIVKPPAVS